MKSKHEFDTEKEANAFVLGVTLVQDIDVSATVPTKEKSQWVVYVELEGL